MKNIMLAFVSTVNPRYISAPVQYKDIQGKQYDAIQTNEAAIVYAERLLEKKSSSLSKIFLIASKTVREGKISSSDYGEITHIEFLRRRIVNEFPGLENKFLELPYSEEGELEKNVLQVADIADAITAYAKECRDKVEVYIDMTGGFRHASMMMMATAQLLKYRDIETREVLYANQTGDPTVYPATEIQRMFDLVTGANEFVKFGSVDSLREYFGENQSPTLKNLLTAMKTFSDAIKICRTAKIESELQNLSKHIKIFRESPDKDLKGEIFAKIIDTIENEYGNLIKGDANRIDIIRWCMTKNFWQQAMTLCTEWLPGELVDRKIYIPTNKIVIDSAEVQGASFGRDWKQELVISFQGNLTEKKNIPFDKNLRNVIKNISNPFAAIIENEQLKNFAEEYKKCRGSFVGYSQGKIKFEDFGSKYPIVRRAIKILYDSENNNPMYGKTFREFFKTLKYEDVPYRISMLPAEILVDFFKLSATVDENAEIENSNRKWQNREEKYREMFSKGLVKSEQDIDTTIRLLHSFYDIRNERNQINHANSTSTTEIGTLKNMIESYLNELEKYPRD